MKVLSGLSDLIKRAQKTSSPKMQHACPPRNVGHLRKQYANAVAGLGGTDPQACKFEASQRT